jgi:dTDP-4-dehydrorhamnose reductase
MSKKILVIGANGMLGGSIFRYFSRQDDFEVLGTLRSQSNQQQLLSMGFANTVAGIDVNDTAALEGVFSNFQPDVVFNCVGLIKQLAASKKAVPAIEINALLPHRLAELASHHGGKLIHFSTDCVFSGAAGMYQEQDTPDASDIYGRSKLLGEVDYSPHLTLRTSIIGHELNSNVSLVDWFLSQQGSVKGFSKAFFSGLPTIFVAKFVHQYVLNNTDLTGLYHLSVDRIDKFSLLTMIKEVYGKDTAIENFSDFAIDRSLDSSKLREAVNFAPPSWLELIQDMHNEYLLDFTS